MHVNYSEFIESVASFLTWFYGAIAILNTGAAWCAWRRSKHNHFAIWTMVALGFGLLSGLAFGGSPLQMPEVVKTVCDATIGPVSFTLGSFFMLLILFRGRRFFVRPSVAWTGLNLSLFLLGLSITDQEFAAIVMKPDNVPIVAMVYLLGFFTWLATAQAVENDDRLKRQLPPLEKEFTSKVLSWPDVVYIELIGCIIATIVLLVWSLMLRAPLEQPANPMVTPNPSKAPWYFLGLQEMLVYFPPWLAGVVFPILIVIGLMAVPYLDFNRKGNGYYTIEKRRFAYLIFQFGFLQLWVLLILIGTFMRGPNWNFFGPFEFQDPHKVMALNNINLSEYFWVVWLGQSMPNVSAHSGVFLEFVQILWREIVGVVALGTYYLALPPLLGRTVLRHFRQKMGFGRYTLMMLFLLTMFTLPLKMILRWTMNMNYLISIPEYFFHF